MSNDDVGRPYGLADRLDELLLRIDLWRDRPPVVVGLVVVAVALAIGMWWLARPPAGPSIDDLIPMAGVTTTTGPVPVGPSPVVGETAAEHLSDGHPSDDEAPPSELVVHVAGAVERPGLVTVTAGSRVDDAIVAAGGPAARADVHRLNLAAPVVDGMQIRVPRVGDDSELALVVVPQAEPGQSPAATGSGPVDVNRATVEQLETLPGVGPATAAAIVAWRTENGPFQSTDELTLVPGIGPAKLAAIRDLITT